MKALSPGDLREALATLGRSPERRKLLIEFLRQQEAGLAAPGFNVREAVTGPIVDALFTEGEVLERTLSSGVRISFPYRSKIARDFVIAPEEKPDHAWEPQTTKLLLTLGAAASHVVIGGAYFGDQAIPLAHAMSLSGKGGICHCFEINEEEIALLQKNASLNGLTNLAVNRLGLWEDDDRKLVLEGDDSHAFSREATATESDRAVSTITIDTYARRRELGRVDLIMLDIEGAELSALRGARNLLAQPVTTAPAVIFEVNSSYVDWSKGLDKAEVVAFLIGLGYRVFGVRDYQSNVNMAGRPIELVPVDDIYLEGPPHGFNLVGFKDPRLVERHGFRVTPGVSPKLLFHRDPRLHQPLS